MCLEAVVDREEWRDKTFVYVDVVFKVGAEGIKKEKIPRWDNG